MFADRYGQEAVGDVARYDLDGNGVTGLPDFFLFADVFGQIVDPA